MESEKEKEKEKEEIEKNENIVEENEKQIDIDNTIEFAILYTDISENICLELEKIESKECINNSDVNSIIKNLCQLTLKQMKQKMI